MLFQPHVVSLFFLFYLFYYQDNGILKSPSEIMDFSIFPYTSVNILSISETIFLSTQKL